MIESQPFVDPRSEFLGTTYEAHVALCQHYSSLVFRGRLAIVTLTVAAVSVALGLIPGSGSAPNGAGNGLLAYASAWLVALLHAVEVSYVRRFFQVVVSGRDLERRIGLQLYFSRYDQPEGWPLRLIYFFAVAVLLVVALARLWSLSAVVPFRPVVIAVAIVAPFVPLVFSVGRAREYFDQHFRPGGRNEGVSPETA